MALVHSKFKDYIKNASEDHFSTASYSVRVGEIIDPKGEVHIDGYTIPSQGLVIVKSQEEFETPGHIMGYATIKTSLSQKGIMTLNIGLIDPGYDGPLSSVMINYGFGPFELRKGDVFLRTTFDEIQGITGPEDLKTKPYKIETSQYLQDRIRQSRERLGDNFMNFEKWVGLSVDETIKRLDSKRRKIWQGIGMGTAILAAIWSIGVFIFDRWEDSKMIKNQMIYANEIVLLRKQLMDIDASLKDLNNSSQMLTKSKIDNTQFELDRTKVKLDSLLNLMIKGNEDLQ